MPQDWILNLSTSISVLHNESIGLTSAGSPWLRYVGYIEWMSIIPWKVDYLFTAVVLKMKKCPKIGYWISVHELQLAVTSVYLILWMNAVLISRLFTAVNMCPKSGYWISVHRLESCTMKASCWLQLVRRDFGIMNIMNECSTNIPWKVDYLFTAVVLKSGYWISVHRFQSCTMKASVWLQMVRRDFGMLDILNESSTKIEK